jgi:hypothetical protein
MFNKEGKIGPRITRICTEITGKRKNGFPLLFLSQNAPEGGSTWVQDVGTGYFNSKKVPMGGAASPFPFYPFTLFPFSSLTLRVIRVIRGHLNLFSFLSNLFS